MQLQKTFKESYMKTLRDDVKSGDSIQLYSGDSFGIDSTKVAKWENLYSPEGLADKLADIWNDDFQSAIAVYEAYKDISPVIASNEAFWAYLTHVDLFSYAQKRWPEVKKDNCSSDYILDHWFVSPKGLLRNAIASLWWGVYLTIDETRDNKYELTEVLFKNYTFRVVEFGAYRLIRHREAMIGILSFLKDNPDVTGSSFEYRGRFISRYFNRLGAVKQLAYLKRDFFYDTCVRMKDRILSVTNRNEASDESLYDEIK